MTGDIPLLLKLGELIRRHGVIFNPSAAVPGSVKDVERLDSSFVDFPLRVFQIPNKSCRQISNAEISADKRNKREIAMLVWAIHLLQENLIHNRSHPDYSNVRLPLGDNYPLQEKLQDYSLYQIAL